MLSMIFDRIADYRTPAWVIIAVLAGGWYLTTWQHATFLPRAEAQTLVQQIDSITLEIRLRSAQDDVSRLEALLWTLEGDPNAMTPGNPASDRRREILQRKIASERYHNCLLEKLSTGADRESIDRCEPLNQR